MARDAATVSAALGLHDHEQHHKDGVYEHDARRLREFVARGRVLSHELGAWPWCHAAGGRLPRGWHGQESFLAPLTAWYGRELDALENERDQRLYFGRAA